MSHVNVEEVALLKVAQLLRSQGYDLADAAGYALAKKELRADNSLGILTQTGKKESRGPFGIFGERIRRVHLGTIWFREHGAHDGRWVIEVHGRGNVSLLTDLGERIAKNFEIEVTVRLTNETERFETLWVVLFFI